MKTLLLPPFTPHLFPHSLFLYLLLCSPANNVSVCCMLPWLFLEPDALRYLPERPTNSGCCVCVSTTLGVCGWDFLPFFLCILRERVREQCSPEAAADRWTSLFCVSGPQQPPGGFGAAPCLSGGQEDEGVECRHKVCVSVAKHPSRFKSWGNCGLVSRPVAINQLIVWQNEL